MNLEKGVKRIGVALGTIWVILCCIIYCAIGNNHGWSEKVIREWGGFSFIGFFFLTSVFQLMGWVIKGFKEGGKYEL